ncbi:NADH-quinone oxidoreductase subunit N [Fundidesulfovibrio soli]|uniref:NADH-quinone oxidoreductase subunit N n=1 Tax=Fundidesulfovibrio soli TaxID=2922716 RepID=UPI001FB0317A|nr:NADH-quinone oxidoreductase subunit N [Fundidesulfovibrio soli]
MTWLSTQFMPHAALAAGGLAVLGAGAAFKRPPKELLLGVSLAAVLCAGFFSGFGAWPPGTQSPMLAAGGLERYFTVLVCAAAGLSMLLIHSYAQERGFSGDALYGLTLWAGLGMLITAQAANLLLLAIGVELMSLCLYALIASRRNDPLALEAALKYFLPGAVALAGIIFGVALVYAGTGEMDMMAALARNSATASVGWTLILVGLGFKLSLAPVHLWTPDVYQGAPAPVTAFLSTGSKAAVAAVLLRLALAAGWGQPAAVLQAAAALTMAAGSIAALSQSSLKRLLAYSSIAQMGFVAMAVLSVRGGGERAAMFSLGVYALMELGAFGAVGLLSPDGSDRDILEDYRGMSYTHPWRAGLLALSLASLGGLPPTAGFIGKFVIFQAALNAGLYSLAVFGMLATIVGLYYCLRVLVTLYTPCPAGAEPERLPAGTPAETPGNLACMAVAALLVAVGLYPAPLLEAVSALILG